MVVERKVSGTENLYVCSVLDVRGDKSGERLKANRLVYGSATLDDMAENLVTFAYKVDDKWWIQSGDESEVPIGDFIVDMFDRSNIGNLGTYWDNSAIYKIIDGYAAENEGRKIEADRPFNYLRQTYLAKLSNYNINYRIKYSADPAEMFAFYNYWDGFSNKFPQYELLTVLLGWDAGSDSGILLRCFIRFFFQGAVKGLSYKIDIGSAGSYDGTILYDSGAIIITDFSDIVFSGTLLCNTDENMLYLSGNFAEPFDFSYDLGEIYNYNIGVRSGFYTDFQWWPSQRRLIDTFKSWVSSIPEPPDESGHGRYIDGQYVYSDKYHAGSEYNPDA